MSTTMATTRTTKDYVPTDFSDLFDHYYDYVTNLVCKFGIDRQNAEDVAMTILTKFLEKDALADYSPEFVSEHGGVRRPAVFSTFLSGFVFAYVRHYRDRQGIQARRESKSTDRLVVGPSGAPAAWIEVYGPSVTDDHEDLVVEDLIRRITLRLETLPPSSRARVDLVALFTRITEQVEGAGKYDVGVLASEFGVSQNSIRNWIHRLRVEVAAVLES